VTYQFFSAKYFYTHSVIRSDYQSWDEQWRLERQTWDDSHFTRGAIIYSPQTVLCTVPQLSAHGKSKYRFDATGSTRVAQIQIDQRGLMRFRIADFLLAYKLTTEKCNGEFLLCYMKVLIQIPSIALSIARQSSLRPRPLLAE
jgi:hypothetical protein